VTAAFRVVLDTNVAMSALVFAQGQLAWARQFWQQGRYLPLVSAATDGELMRALTYPKFKLSRDDQQELLADYLPYCITVRIPVPPPKTQPCRDPSDIPFLQLALTGKADYLVTRDKDLLNLAGKFPPSITTAEEFRGSLTTTGNTLGCGSRM